MNRLKGLACYLSGPIDYVEDQGQKWRDNITPFLESRNVQVFNPLKPIFHGSYDNADTLHEDERRMLSNGQFEDLHKTMKQINRWDLRAIDLSSFVIANYDMESHMCGTLEEIFAANKQCKPVLIKVHNLKQRPRWLIGRFPPEHFFDSWSALKDYLVNVDSEPEYEFAHADKKRWLFLAGDHMK